MITHPDISLSIARGTTTERGRHATRRRGTVAASCTTHRRASLRHRLTAVALAVATTVGLALTTAPAASAHTRTWERAPVTDLADGDLVGIATVRRDHRGIRAALSTTGLDRHHAHTVWAVVFNHPEECDGPCDATDLDDPAVGGVSTWLAGRVARGGITSFRGGLRVGDELTDPRRAEIHLVVRTHGRVIRHLRHEQLTTLNGGCPPNECANVQASVHG